MRPGQSPTLPIAQIASACTDSTFYKCQSERSFTILKCETGPVGGAADGTRDQDPNHRSHSYECQQQSLAHAYYPPAQTGEIIALSLAAALVSEFYLQACVLGVTVRSFPKRASQSNPTLTWWIWRAASVRGHRVQRLTGSKRAPPSTSVSPPWAMLLGLVILCLVAFLFSACFIWSCHITPLLQLPC